MQVTTVVSGFVPAPPESVYDYLVVPETVVEVYPGAWPIPGVTGVRVLEGGVRRVSTADGGEIDEQFTEMERPAHLAYGLLGGFAFPFRLLVRSARGDFRLDPLGEGTAIRWQYWFELTTPVLLPLGLLAVKVFYRRAMRQGLSIIARRFAG